MPPAKLLRPMSQEILEKVRSIVAEQLSVDAAEVKPESNFQNDLGADSLDTVELVMALEDELFDCWKKIQFKMHTMCYFVLRRSVGC